MTDTEKELLAPEIMELAAARKTLQEAQEAATAAENRVVRMLSLIEPRFLNEVERFQFDFGEMAFFIIEDDGQSATESD